MIIRFVHHSCFLVEIDDKVLIFDYFNGDRVNGFHFQGTIPEYEADTKIYVFASHTHQDHYDMDVLRWADKYPNIKYIFSKDIRVSPHFLKKHGIDPKIRERILFTTPCNSYELDDLKIKTFRSTDAGVAFFVDTNGVSFYHAGDLNDWTWEGAGDLVNGRVRSNYHSQIQMLAKNPIHIAFVVMDPRQNEHQYRGIEYFLKNTDCEYVFPMHMWQDYSGIAKFKKRITSKDMQDKIIDISHENQEFNIDIY